MSLPLWVGPLVRGAVPEEFAEDLLADLEEGFHARGAGIRAWRWLLLELVRTPYVALWREARRRRGRRPRGSVRPGGGGNLSGAAAGLRIAARSLLRRPSYAAVSVVTLIVSVGSATLIFSVLEGVLLRPLPYAGGDRVYRLFATNQAWREAEQEVLRDSWDRLDLSREVIGALPGRVSGAEAVGGYMNMTARLDDGGHPPAQEQGAWLLPGFFHALELPPIHGRLPSDEEIAAGDAVVVLSGRLWSSRYGRDPDALGRSLSLDGVPHTIIGVLPSAFTVPSELARWWAPVPPDFDRGRADAAVFRGLLRLTEGADPSVAAESVQGVLDALAEENSVYADLGTRLVPLREEAVSDVEGGIRLLFLAVVVVVLIASVNLANLVVARGARRRGELAMRAALGASRGALIWAVMSETTLLCLIGGGLGVLVATTLLRPFLHVLTMATPGFPRMDNIGLNLTVLGFSFGVAVLTILLSGFFPALAASRRSPWEALQAGLRTGGGRATRRTQHSLLLVESALAITLLVTAGLLVRSALEVARMDPGYRAESVAYGSIRFPEGKYATPAEAEALGRALEARVGRLPGMVGTARTSSLPGLGGADGKLVWTPDQTSADGTLIWSSAVSPGYFEVMGIPLLEGRGFQQRDGPDDEQVAVVSELFAQRFFPEGDVVGRTVMIGTGTRFQGGAVAAEGSIALRIVGVVGDIRQLAVIMEPDAMLYRPIGQTSPSDLAMVWRTVGSPQLEAARSEIGAEDSSLLVADMGVLGRSMRRLVAPLRVRMILILSLAAVAALLTVVGIYGVVSHVVADQVHEIGIRIALGARAGGESARMVRQALRPVLVGAAIGLVGAWAASGLVESALFGVEPLDPSTYAAVLVLLGVSAALAAWFPARRAAAVDPMRVLTGE